jgi:hypothetical protein
LQPPITKAIAIQNIQQKRDRFVEIPEGDRDSKTNHFAIALWIIAIQNSKTCRQNAIAIQKYLAKCDRFVETRWIH